MTADRLVLPTGEIYDVLVTGEASRGEMFSLEGTLPPGCGGPPAHRHRRQAEDFTVLDGVLRVRIGDEHRDLHVGETVVVPPGITHGFANPTSAITRFRSHETPADQLEHQLRLLAESGRLPPLRRFAALNVDWDLSFELSTLPAGLQRLLWRALAWSPVSAGERPGRAGRGTPRRPAR